MTVPLIQISDVSKRYDDGPPALAGLTLRIDAGEAVAVLGASGSGKSTLLNLIAGLDRPTSGSVTVDGVRVDGLGEAASAKYRRARIGMVFQFFNLVDDLTVHDNVLLPAQLAGVPRGEATARAGELLERLGVQRHAKAFPGRLSGGERQRVAVARALMNRPALLLADEPTGDLDELTGDALHGLLRDMHKEHGLTSVIATHNPRLAAACDRVLRLERGRLQPA